MIWTFVDLLSRYLHVVGATPLVGLQSQRRVIPNEPPGLRET
jgi:hypothetical protein